MAKQSIPYFRILFIFAFGFTSTLSFNVALGTLRVGEILALLGILLVLFSGRVFSTLREPFVHRSIIAIVVWMVFQILSDNYNGTDTVKTLKGLANLGFSITTFFFLIMTVDKSLLVLYSLLLGRALGAFLLFDYLATSDEILSNEYWDIRVSVWGGPLAVLCGLILARYSRLAAFFGMFAYGGLAIAYGGRSHGFIFCCSALAVLVLPHIKKRFATVSRRTVTRYVVVGTMMLCVVYPTFVYLGLQGLITSKTERQLSEVRNPYNPIELIVAGRAGVELGTTAIKKRPIAGYGSGAYDGDYLPLEFSLAREGYNFIHSRFFESWAFGGVVCGLSCVVLLLLTLQLSYSTVQLSRSEATLVATYVAISQTWAFLFSPLAGLRLGWPIAAVTVWCLYRHYQQSGSNPGGYVLVPQDRQKRSVF